MKILKYSIMLLTGIVLIVFLTSCAKYTRTKIPLKRRHRNSLGAYTLKDMKTKPGFPTIHYYY